MKTLCTLLAAAILLSVPASVLARDWYSPEEGALKGRQSLQFSIEQNLTLSAFQGQMISYQKFLTDDRALRVAAGLSLDLNMQDLDVEYYGGGETGAAEVSTWGHSGTLKVQMLFYRGDGPIRLFWGAGPKVSYTDVHSESVNYSSYDGDVVFVFYTGDTDRWELGLQGFAGLEWFINDLFSVHAEYAVSGSYTFEDKLEQRLHSHDPDSDRRIATSTTSPEFDSDGVRFGLSAHF